jgi:ABC-type polysaccharide/polyol phosphate transport system ATPase subunit
MAAIVLDNVTLRYPIYGTASRSIRSSLLSKLGGRIEGRDRTIVVEALTRLSLSLADGDRLGVIGPNGSGKSSLLRVMSGIYSPQEGSVGIEGKLSTLVDISLGMDPDATGWENITFRGIFLGLTFKQATALAPEVAEFSELGEYLSLPLRTYSSGMYLRLAFAIATSVHPDIIIMDEMISAGDAGFYNKASARMNQLVDRTKIVVVASHHPSIIESFCNKVLWLEKGKMRAFGPAKEVLSAYSDDVGDVEKSPA